jgi:hypothetical protein
MKKFDKIDMCLREVMNALTLHHKNIQPVAKDIEGVVAKISNDAEAAFSLRPIYWAVDLRREEIFFVKNVLKELQYDEQTFNYRLSYQMLHPRYVKLFGTFELAWYQAMAQKFQSEASNIQFHIKVPIRVASGRYYFVVKRFTIIEAVDAAFAPAVLIHKLDYERSFNPQSEYQKFEICVFDNEIRRTDIETEIKRIARPEILKTLGFRPIQNQQMFKTMRLHLKFQVLNNTALAQKLKIKPRAVTKTFERVTEKLRDYFGWVSDMTPREIGEILDDLGLLPPDADSMH